MRRGNNAPWAPLSWWIRALYKSTYYYYYYYYYYYWICCVEDLMSRFEARASYQPRSKLNLRETNMSGSGATLQANEWPYFASERWCPSVCDIIYIRYILLPTTCRVMLMDVGVGKVLTWHAYTPSSSRVILLILILYVVFKSVSILYRPSMWTRWLLTNKSDMIEIQTSTRA